MWEITESGRDQLKKERDSWDIKKYQQSKVTVVISEPGETPLPPVPPVSDGWNPPQWKALAQVIGDELFETLDQRLRPDLLPTPTSESNYVARNLVFYGPPGTGRPTSHGR